ncbi:retrovirus-related pol polyprotein from transposon TNT 1-94 [Tanacetum coccineum]
MKQPQPNNNFNLQPSFNTNYMQQPMPNPEDITDPTTAMNMKLVLMAKAFKLNYSTQTNNNQRISSNPCNRQIAQPVQNVRNQVVHNTVQNVGNQNGLIVVLGIANQNLNLIGNGNVVAAPTEGNGNGNNAYQIRCYNCRGLGHLARNCTVRPRKRDDAFLQTHKHRHRVLDKALVYDSDGSAEVHEYDNCYNNKIFNMFTQEEQYTELLEPIPEPHQVQQNDSNVIFVVYSVEQGRGTVEQHPITIEETRSYFESLYNNLAIEVEKVNSVNRKMKETNADLIIELARYKNQEKCFEISQEKYDKLERCYQKSVYQEQSVVSQDIMSVVQNPTIVETSDLQTELERTKERFENSYNDLQQKIERLQAQLGDLKGKCKDTPCVSDTLDPLSQKLENENVELEFQVLNYAKENAHLKTTYKNLIDPRKTSREDKFVPINKIKASVRTNPITISQPQVITKKDVNYDSNGLSSIRVDNTAKTRRPQPRSNTKNDRVLSASKSSCFKNKEFEVIQIGLWCVDSGCSKHMAGNLKLLINFVWKFLGTIRFRNDHVAAILGYNDLQWRNILITWVYFIKGLRHNLFSVGQFCNSDLEVAFRRNTCFIRNLEGVDLLKRNHTTNLYIINLQEMVSTSPIFLMARATSTKSWL